MKWALDTKTGRVVTLNLLMSLRALEIASFWGRDRSHAKIIDVLNEGIFCPECRNPVHVYGIKKANGFELAGRALSRVNNRIPSGFHHYTPENKRNNGIKPVKECVLYCPDDPRFKDLKKKQKDPQIEKRVKAIVNSPSIKAINRRVLKRLHYIATGKPITREDVETYICVAQDGFLSHEVFITHPYALPYAVMADVPFFERTGRNGPYHVKFQERGVQELLFKDSADEVRIAKVPEFLGLAFQTKRGSWAPMHSERTLYPVTEKGALTLIGWDHVPQQTAILSVPRSLLEAPRPQRQAFLPGINHWYSLHSCQ